MPVDNEICNQPGDIWWDEHQPLHTIRTSLNPPRVEYFTGVFAAQGIDLTGKVAIDVGCGGGLMAEEMARLGASVVGVNPSRGSIATAQSHADAAGLAIDYRVGSGRTCPWTMPAPTSSTASMCWSMSPTSTPSSGRPRACSSRVGCTCSTPSTGPGSASLS